MTATAAPVEPPRRLYWLDALRGVAVAAVVFEHLTYRVLGGVRELTAQVVHAGTYGVMLFFLVSGYVIAASLERHGDLRRFWLGRLRRLYPMWALAVGSALAVCLLLPDLAPAGLRDDLASTLLANATMLQELLDSPAVINVLWTLSYEMAFYLLVTAAYALGVHQFGAETALGVTAVAVLGGAVLPVALLSTMAGRGPFVVIAVGLLGASLWGVLSGRAGAARAGAVALAVFVVTLLAVNQRPGGWEGFVILGVMFAGTVLYRADRGELRHRATIVVVVVFGGAAVCAVTHGGMWFLDELPPAQAARSWIGAVVLAAATFLAARSLFGDGRRGVPTSLVRLGVISYSVYLLHQGVVLATGPVLDLAARGSWPGQVAAAAGYLAVLLACCSLTYRLVERPARSWGRTLRLARRDHGR